MDLRIKDVCREKGITQKELAGLLGVSEMTLSRASKGNTSLELIDRIAQVLNIGPAELFGERGDFVAFVRRNGETRTFDTEGDLIEYVDTLKTR